MLKLKDKNKKLVAGLINYKDLCIESTLSTGDKKLSFSLHKEDKFYNLIEEECYIETKTQEYVIKARDVGVDYTRFDCVLNLEELEANIFDRFESVEQTITASLNLAIVGTGWTVKDNTLKKKRTVRCTNKNALEIVQEIKKTYRADIVFNTLKREIEVYEHLGEDKGTYFIDSLNITALQVQSDSYKFATRIIAEGKDGLSFSDINNGKNYVENYQYSRKVKTIYWKDERYTVKESLLEDAKAKLEEISKPYTSYNASILNLAELNPKYKNILDYKLGDTITLLSKSNKVKDKQRIVKTIEWPQDHTKDTVELANATLKFEDIQQENQETTDTVNNITSDNGTLDSNAIEDNSIEIKKIDNFEANVLKVTKLDVINANIENLHANKADIQDLNAVKATVGQLEATKANITQLNATNAEISKLDTLKANIVDLNSATAKIGVLEAKTTSIDNLLSQKADIKDLNTLNANISNALIKKANVAELEAMEAKTNKLIANKADISDLNAANANINSIKADTADIKTLINGNLSSENIQTGGITSDKLTISDGFIKDAMIANVSASKITAGTIDAAKINVVNLNADNLTVGKINGQLLKDGSISGLAIENGAIDNNKVSPNANIEASKINISSVVTAINEGSTLLTANKVTIDSEKGTLDVAFNNLNTSLEANKKVTESNSTAINVVQGKLSASIENSKILEGKQKTLEDNYNRTVVTVDSLKNTVGQQKTLIDSATGKITSVEVKANTLEKDLSGLTQTVTDTKKVIENNKTSLESKNAELKANIDKVSSSLSSVSNTVDKNNKTLVAKTNTLEQNLSGLSQTVANNKTVIDGKITSVEGQTHELKAGLGGLTSKLDTLKNTTDGINKTVSNQSSAINQLQDSIKLKVDSSTFTQSTQTINSNIKKAKEDAINTANNAINNLQISTRNLAKNSNFKFGWRDWGFNNPNNNAIAKVIKDNILESCVKVTTYTSNQGVYAILKRKPKTTYSWSVMLKADKPCKLNMVHERGEGSEIINLTTEWTKFTGTGIWNGDGGALCFYSNGNNPEITYYLTNLIYVEGDKVGDWTPAPEDLQAYADEVAKAKADLAQANAIANSDGKITEEERKRIQQAQENLNTAIAKATEAETKAKSYADTKKQEAINAASTDATNKANNALNNAKAYTNTEITTVNTHLNKATAEINILKEKIESKVSQSDIDKSISEIKLGDRNLITKDINNLKTWNIVAFPERIEIINNKYDNILNFKNTSSGWEVLYKAINVNPNKYYVLSFDYSVFKNYYCLDHYKFKLEISTSIPDNNVTKNVIAYHEIENIQTELKRVSLKFKPLVNTIYLVLNGGYLSDNQSNIKFNFNKFKLIEGNKTTDDWTPAPEDTDQLIIDNIKTVTDKITTVESKLTQENNSIKASVQDLNSTTQSITTNVSNINRDLTNKINSNLDAAKSFATDIAIAKANTAKQEAINTANSNTTNVINNLQIGDRNLAFKTDSESVQVGNNTVNQTQSMYGLNIEELKGKKITISFDWSVDGENISGTFYTQLNNTPWTNFTDTVTVSNSNKKGHITKTINMPNEISATSIMCRKDNFIGTLKIRKLKIVIGNKIGDWSPAPEDLQAYADEVAKAKSELAKQQAIADSDGKITEEERKRIQQAQENLNTAIARADKAKQDAINAASVDATNKTNNALNSAKAYVNAEITTVNTKVSNVESNLNILKDKINTKVSQSDIDKSILQVKTDRVIYARGTGNDYPANSIVKVNGKTITDGQGRGLRINALNKITLERVFLEDYDTYGDGNAINNFANKINELNKGDYIIIVTSQDASYPLNPTVKGALEKIGATLFDNKQGTFREAYALIGKSKLGRGNGVEMFIPRTANDKRFAEVSVKVGEDGTFIGVNPNNIGLEATLIKSNISDVSSSVTQLRDSVTTDIRAINSKTQSIETTLGGKASKQEVTEVNNRVATIKANLDSITQRVSSTESKTNSLETNINGKASKQEVNNVSSKVVSLETNLNGITNRVSNTESRINTLNGQVANAVTIQQFTEFKQSNKDFQLKISQTTNLHNLVPNGTFAGGLREWICGGEFWNGSYTGYGFSGKICGAVKNKSTSEKFLTSYKAFKVEKNTTYTLNFHYKVEQNVQSMEAFVMLSNTESGDYGQIIKVMQALGGERSDLTNDIPHTFTFNTGNFEWVWLRFDHNGMKQGTNWDEYCWLYISEVAVYKGSVGAVKYLPKSGENYDTTFLFDGMGFQGNFDDGSYAYLGKEGLEWYNAGTGHAYHALTYVTSFDIPIGNPGKAYIKLPAEFTKRRSSLKWTVALRGYYYSTSGDFFPFHIHCTGGRDYIENGLVVCEVQGYCKIQNAQNAGDIQFRPLTAMLIAIA